MKSAGIQFGREFRVRHLIILPVVAIIKRLQDVDHLGEMEQFEL